TPDVEDVQDGALRNAVSGTLGDFLCKQSFELPQVCDLGADVIKMMRSDLAHICARRLSRSPQGEQGADVFETETKLTAASDEGENTSLCWSIDAAATFGTRGWPQHPYLLVVAYGFDIDAGQWRQFANRYSVLSGRSGSCG